jgi:hypothetical protein
MWKLIFFACAVVTLVSNPVLAETCYSPKEAAKLIEERQSEDLGTITVREVEGGDWKIFRLFLQDLIQHPLSDEVNKADMVQIFFQERNHDTQHYVAFAVVGGKECAVAEWTLPTPVMTAWDQFKAFARKNSI